MDLKTVEKQLEKVRDMVGDIQSDVNKFKKEKELLFHEGGVYYSDADDFCDAKYILAQVDEHIFDLIPLNDYSNRHFGGLMRGVLMSKLTSCGFKYLGQFKDVYKLR